MVLDQFAAIVDEGSADSSGIVRSKVLMHQKQQTSVLQRTLYDEIGSNLGKNYRLIRFDSFLLLTSKFKMSLLKRRNYNLLNRKESASQNLQKLTCECKSSLSTKTSACC